VIPVTGATGQSNCGGVDSGFEHVEPTEPRNALEDFERRVDLGISSEMTPVHTS
jgi:hypothetical protein